MALFPPGEPFFMHSREQPRWQRWFVNSVALLLGIAMMVFGVVITLRCADELIRGNAAPSLAAGAAAPHRQVVDTYVAGSLCWLIGVVFAGLAAWDVFQLVRSKSPTSEY